MRPTSGRRLAGLRLAAHRLAGQTSASPADAVRWMLALQAQDFAGVKWSVGLRSADVTEADVEAACDRREIVRSWPLRGTLHLVAAEDLPWMLELTSARALASAAGRRAALGLGDADIERAGEIAAAVLAGGRSLSRTALLAAFDAGGVATNGQRGYHLLWYLAQTGAIVLGASHGRQQTYARLDEWVRAPRRLERDEALGELALRYFRSHGPATVPDLVRWSGLTVREVRRGVAVAGAALVTIDVDDVRYHLAPEVLDLAGSEAFVLLLPGFDEYLLGYRDRSAVLAPEHADAIVPGGNGMFRATIVVDGRVVGTWARRITARGVTVEARPFDPLPPAAAPAMEAAAQAYGRFLRRPASVVAPHPPPLELTG